MAELPDAIALNDEPKNDDQRRGLERRKDMQPGRRGDEPEREAGKARDECGSEAGSDEQPDLDGVHGRPSRSHAGGRDRCWRATDRASDNHLVGVDRGRIDNERRCRGD
jgi:hypothetical protein